MDKLASLARYLRDALTSAWCRAGANRRLGQEQAELLVAKAHTICPYSKATRGNIEVVLKANGKAITGG